jgi:hypothetical protein
MDQDDNTPVDEDEDEYDAETAQRANTLGGRALEGKMGAIAARLERNSAAWRKEHETRPENEVRAKAKMAEKKDRHKECLKQNNAAPAKKAERKQRDLYEYKWMNAQRNYTMRQILAYIGEGVTDTVDILNYIGACRDTFGDYKRELVEKGRITVTQVGRKYVMALVPVARPVRAQNPAKYDGRKYGNLEYKRGTIMTVPALHPPMARVQDYSYPAAEHMLGADAKVDKDYPLKEKEHPPVGADQATLDAWYYQRDARLVELLIVEYGRIMGRKAPRQ